MPIKALYYTFGCKLNFAETATIAQQLSELGIQKASASDTPDLIIVNTCSVTELADKKCRQAIRAFSRKYPDAAVVATGCYAQLKPQEVAQLPGVAIVAGNDRKLQIVDFVKQWLSSKATINSVIPGKEFIDFSPSCSSGDRTRYFLKVQDGCNYFCSYCTIPFARGKSRSGTIDDIVAQAQNVAMQGGKEIVITGVNIGDFGYGRKDTFFDLMKRLDDIEQISRYRISSIEPNLLTDEMIHWVAQSRSFMPHFHIPLQSGNNEVLELMRRRYRRELFAEKVRLIRSEMPHAFLGVDLIVGARGETIERYEDSKAFVEGLDISRLHVFPYSERPGTSALVTIDHTVDQAEKHSRVNEMMEISNEKLSQFHRRFDGERRKVLVEHTCKRNTMYGFTDNYIKVALPVDKSLYNTEVWTTLKFAPDSQFEEMKGITNELQ